jgi:hypothetical protein
MTEPSNEDVMRRYLAAHQAHDYETVDSLRHPDWTAEWPQSGERVRGAANDRKIMDNWPGGLPQADDKIRLTGSEDRWVVTPSWTFQRIAGSGDAWWADATARYPDGSTWFAVGLFELRNGKLHRERWFFGPPLDPPSWRAAWVEKLAD